MEEQGAAAAASIISRSVFARLLARRKSEKRIHRFGLRTTGTRMLEPTRRRQKRTSEEEGTFYKNLANTKVFACDGSIPCCLVPLSGPARAILGLRTMAR